MYFSISLVYPSLIIVFGFFQGLDHTFDPNHELRKKIIKTIVLDQWSNSDSKEFIGYNLFIFIGEGTVQEVMIREPLFDSELLPISRESYKRFSAEVKVEELLPYYGCVLIIPVLHKIDSKNTREKNFAEGVKSMTPFAEYRDFKCIQFLEPIVVNRTIRY